MVVSAASAAIIVGSATWALANDGHGSSLPPAVTDATAFPTPYFHPFVSFDGTFFVHPWDDREIGEEAKRSNPLYNPAWVPFSECVAAGGLEVRADPSTKYDQQDLDRLLERVNRENPDRAANLRLPPKPTGSAGTFVRCAEEWLTKSPAEIEKLTGITEPGPK